LTRAELVAATGFPTLKLSALSPAHSWPTTEPDQDGARVEVSRYLVRQDPYGPTAIMSGDVADRHPGLIGILDVRAWRSTAGPHGHVRIAAVLTEEVPEAVLERLAMQSLDARDRAQLWQPEVTIEVVMVPGANVCMQSNP
jgi:hypothetical protein